MGGEDNEGNMDKLMQTMINKTKKTKSKLQLKREIRRLTQKI